MTGQHTSHPPSFDIAEFGDSHLRARALTGTDEEKWQLVHAVAARINAHKVDGLSSAIATYDTVVVAFDALQLDPEGAVALVQQTTAGPRRAQQERSSFSIPVLFGGAAGPDLGEVAEQQRMEQDELVHALTQLPLVVRCYSHHASAMLDGPHLPRQVLRRRDPRVSVPSGSISVAGRQAVMHACAGPSGWQLVGRTPLRTTQLVGPAFTSYRPGDSFHFRSITEDEWRELEGAAMEDHRESSS